jgi:hypothetical protein
MQRLTVERGKYSLATQQSRLTLVAINVNIKLHEYEMVVEAGRRYLAAPRREELEKQLKAELAGVKDPAKVKEIIERFSNRLAEEHLLLVGGLVGFNEPYSPGSVIRAAREELETEFAGKQQATAKGLVLKFASEIDLQPLTKEDRASFISKLTAAMNRSPVFSQPLLLDKTKILSSPDIAEAEIQRCKKLLADLRVEMPKLFDVFER